MARGYPDFLITPGFANYGTLYRVAWNGPILATEVLEVASLAGAGRLVTGYVNLWADETIDVPWWVTLIVDGTSFFQPSAMAMRDLQAVGNSVLNIQMTRYALTDFGFYGGFAIRSDLSWGLSFKLEVTGSMTADGQTSGEFWYRRVEATP